MNRTRQQHRQAKCMRLRRRVRLLLTLGMLVGGIALSNGCNSSTTTGEAETPSTTLDKNASIPSQSSGVGSNNNAANASSSASRFDFAEVTNGLPGGEYRNGFEKDLFSLPETTGGGLAVFDLDRDGLLDVVCAGGGYPDIEAKRLLGHRGYVYRGIESFRFVDCTDASRVDMSQSYNAAVIAADYDNDGFTDFVVTGFDSVQIYHNLGDGTFAFSTLTGDTLWSSSAAFADIDGDGDLDLYVTHYADWSFDKNPFCPSQYDGQKRDYCGPRDFKGLGDALYENLGDGSFESRADKLADVKLRGLGVIAADLDDDRDIDLYVANDVDANLLYRNKGAWSLDEMGRRSGVACDDLGRPEGSMGIAIGDYNLDGKFDLWVTNYQNEICALYRNNGNMSFNYASNSARIATTDERSVGWGTTLEDLDFDGDEDIIVINGHLERYSNSSTYSQLPQILDNVDGKYFRAARCKSEYFNTPQVGRGLAVGDFDRDGRIDLAVTRLNGPYAIVRNQTSTVGQYLAVRLIGTQSNRDAIGAVVRLSVGDRTWVRQVYGGGSYASTNDRTVHIGIPESLVKLSGKLTIAWPSGRDQMLDVEHWNAEIIAIEPK